MRKVIEITIPADLSDKQELNEIGKRLNQKMLSGNGKNKQSTIKKIGQEINIKRLETTIVIKRKSKCIEFVPCNVCGCEYQDNLFEKVFTNYGGKTRVIKVCSKDCQTNLIDICGIGRAGLRKADLKQINFIR